VNETTNSQFLVELTVLLRYRRRTELLIRVETIISGVLLLVI